ncbi:MAG: FMN-binding protein [Actinobacteria bacterium]|nr:FMN-binding protein [Actinomycetota bacterium]MBU1943643.1 FMN-binding protein [Actinomycetota bacterium]MBU2687532.1 FMN-binding protein [Actinomycetota bacterium]
MKRLRENETVRLGVTLMVVGLVAALGLGLTYTVTRKKIAEQDRMAEAEAAADALPGVESPSELKEDKSLTTAARKQSPAVQKVFTNPLGRIYVVRTKGYGGPLTLAVGIGPDGEVKGIAVVESRETVGVGSKALEPGNLEKYEGKKAKDELAIGKDVQAITGATITSKAVAAQVKAALEADRTTR